MDGSDERAADEGTPGERARPGYERRHAEQASARVRQDVRRLLERLRQGAEAVAATENGVAATHLTLAERALREGRLEDARQLLSEAAAALRGVEHERRRADRWPEVTTPEDTDVASAERRRIAAARARDDAARRRDQAARLRDEAALHREQAAQQRDEVAAERDQRAVERAVAAEHREAAADERRAEQVRWQERTAASAGGVPSEEREQQRAIDAEVAGSYRALTEDDRTRAAADRAADAADRLAAERDRIATAQDREDARVDRERAARDRAAAVADHDRSADAELGDH